MIEAGFALNYVDTYHWTKSMTVKVETCKISLTMGQPTLVKS